MTKSNNSNDLRGPAQFSLFISSYLPLLMLIILRQISENFEYLNWGGINTNSIVLLIQKFGLSIVLTILSILGGLGYFSTFYNLEKVSLNGSLVKVTDVKNKNSESIGYIATYIVPFLFQSFNGWYECISILILMGIIYKIYVNSSLLLINPLMSIFYAIYEIEYDDNMKIKNGLIISKNKYLEEYTIIKIYPIGHKLFYSIDNN